MATHAHSTRTPLLRPSAEAPALLGLGLGRQPGPVTIALAAMHAADPDRVRELRRRIAERIEADLALLDALDGDTDLEDGADAEPSLCGLDVAWPSHGGDDREDGDDNGIADDLGATEQALRFLDAGGDFNAAHRFAGRVL